MAAGRPTKYKDEYCEKALEFFAQEPFEVFKLGDGTPLLDRHGKLVTVACRLPTKEGLAISLEVASSTLYLWIQEHKEFSDIIKRCEDHQKEILIQNGLMGNYDRTSWIFTAKNVTDMKDQQDLNHMGGIKINRIDSDKDDEAL